MLKLLFNPSVKFAPQDIWVGIYWKRYASFLSVYLCLVPCFPIITHWRIRG